MTRRIYRRVEVATRTDERFRRLSAPPPNGQTLWYYLLCGERTTIFPGLVIAREAVMADDLGWTIEGFRQAFGEALGEGLVEADWKAGVVVLKKALLDSHGDPRETARPESPNVLRKWAKSWSEVPECALKNEYLRQLGSFAKALGEGYLQAYGEAFAKALAEASRHPSSNQDSGDRRQESGLARAHAIPSTTAAPAPAPSTTPTPPSGASAENTRVIAAAQVDFARARGEYATQLWRRMDAERSRIAKRLGLSILPFPPIAPSNQPKGFRELLDRLREEGEHYSVAAERVFANLVDQAEDKKSLEWLSEKGFSSGAWTTARNAEPKRKPARARIREEDDWPDLTACLTLTDEDREVKS